METKAPAVLEGKDSAQEQQLEPQKLQKVVRLSHNILKSTPQVTRE